MGWDKGLGKTITEAHKMAFFHRTLAPDDIDLIQELVDKLPETRLVKVVDLGAGIGVSTCSILCARPDRITVTTIDNDQSTLQWPERVAANIGRRDDWQGILMDSAEAAKEFKANSVDLLLIDTDHTYKTTKQELKVWLPKVVRGGYIWLHDYLPPSAVGWGGGGYPGVKQAVDEMVAVGKLELIEIRGLGWAGRKRT